MINIADYIAMILTHDVLKALFPYIIIIMLGVVISRLGKVILKLDMIIEHFDIKIKVTNTVSEQEQNTESNQDDKNDNDITNF